jgi:hypothetical protein
VAVLKHAIAAYQINLSGKVEKRQKLRDFLKEEELKALSILKKHDTATFNAYKESVASSVKAAYDKQHEMEQKLTKFEDDQESMVAHLKQKFEDQID